MFNEFEIFLQQGSKAALGKCQYHLIEILQSYRKMISINSSNYIYSIKRSFKNYK